VEDEKTKTSVIEEPVGGGSGFHDVEEETKKDEVKSMTQGGRRGRIVSIRSEGTKILLG